jgi:hypothetical protein
MKRMKKVLLLCIIATTTYTAGAQSPPSSRQNQFSKLSSKLATPLSELEKAFLAPEGTKLQLKFSNLTFSGIVLSSVKKYDNLYKVVIKSSSLDNTLFSISKRIEEDSAVTYIGRIINEKYADGYELKKESDGSYSLNKIQTEDLIQDF